MITPDAGNTSPQPPETNLMQPTSEMQFGRTDSPSITLATAYPDGQVTLTVQNAEVPGHACDNELALSQVIQLRDFLNRHIDGFALAATGSTVGRATDDPSQLACEELLQLSLDCVAAPLLPVDKRVDAPAGTLHLVWNTDKTSCVGFYDSLAAQFTAHGKGPQHLIPAIGVALREQHLLLEQPLPQTTVTFR